MTKDELILVLKEKLLISRRTLKGYAQSRKISDLLLEYTSFLSSDTPRNVRCWHLIYNVESVPLCINCSINTTNFNNNKWGYLDYCSVKCQRNSDIVKQKMVKSLEKKYGEGITNPFMADEVKSDIRQKMLTKFGVDHNFKRKDLIALSMREKYGVDHYSQTNEFKEKYSQTIMKRYGVEHYSQTYEFLDKCKKKWKSTLGVEHPMHDIEIAENVITKLHKTKKIKLPTGVTALLQGYEPYALALLYEKHEVNDIVVEKKEIESYVGKIFYTDFNGKIHRYYPDFYIISSRTIIEVKSTWTYNRNGFIKNDENINILKKDACISKGFLFTFIIIDKNIIKNLKKNQHALEIVSE